MFILQNEFSTQQSQGTWHPEGYKDVLVEAMGTPDHSGRLRGQSKWVKPTAYFDVPPPPTYKSKIDSLERQVQELMAIVHGKKTSGPVDVEDRPPTVDQHNSYRASCSLNEIHVTPTTPQPDLIPQAGNEESRECLLFIDNEKGDNPLYVASGRVWVHSQPTDTIHGTLIGDGNVRVSIEIAKVKKAPLPIPTFEATTVVDAINSFVAWPKRLVELNRSIESYDRPLSLTMLLKSVQPVLQVKINWWIRLRCNNAPPLA